MRTTGPPRSRSETIPFFACGYPRRSISVRLDRVMAAAQFSPPQSATPLISTRPTSSHARDGTSNCRTRGASWQVSEFEKRQAFHHARRVDDDGFDGKADRSEPERVFGQEGEAAGRVDLVDAVEFERQGPPVVRLRQRCAVRAAAPGKCGCGTGCTGASAHSTAPACSTCPDCRGSHTARGQARRRAFDRIAAPDGRRTALDRRFGTFQ
jgi:hypothetical protein